MPWRECHAMDERLRFVAGLLEREKMAPPCAEFGISRKTGYKIFDRYKDCGVQAFSDRTGASSPGESVADAPAKAARSSSDRRSASVRFRTFGAPEVLS